MLCGRGGVCVPPAAGATLPVAPLLLPVCLSGFQGRGSPTWGSGRLACTSGGSVPPAHCCALCPWLLRWGRVECRLRPPLLSQGGQRRAASIQWAVERGGLRKPPARITVLMGFPPPGLKVWWAEHEPAFGVSR